MEVDKKEVGKRIKSIRIKLKETTAEFAEHFTPPASNSLVSRWERGVNLPNNERIEVISKLGNMSVEELLYGNKNINEPPEAILKEDLSTFIDSKREIVKQEANLLTQSGLEGLLRLVGLGKGLGDKALEEYKSHRERLNDLENFGKNYIESNYSNYTYEDYLQDFPNSNPNDFLEYKERARSIFKEVLDSFWEAFDLTTKNNTWINSRFTIQISEELNEISKKAVEEGKEHYYVNEVVQPFLDQAAKDFKEYIKDYIDTED